MEKEMTRFQKDVQKELEEMKLLGMYVPDSAFALAKDASYLKQYDSMKVSECADLLIELAVVEDAPVTSANDPTEF